MYSKQYRKALRIIQEISPNGVGNNDVRSVYREETAASAIFT
jgi:DNA-directed RNA polymerase specialized sigma54-like protein